ncbi:hypothetical protein Clacol_009344 [Clathrus columnatus]|uniref:DNA-directed RNA polymerase RBP11-like dimerisation domain-containing protein n=1 Tax=Clathrus columnatus TaxID=1419009 RepID=A0AAV5AQT4_9AGAM|nr:hypothetical protein Clacol_009344 [Clathrus columnatus]
MILHNNCEADLDEGLSLEVSTFQLGLNGLETPMRGASNEDNTESADLSPEETAQMIEELEDMLKDLEKRRARVKEETTERTKSLEGIDDERVHDLFRRASEPPIETFVIFRNKPPPIRPRQLLAMPSILFAGYKVPYTLETYLIQTDGFITPTEALEQAGNALVKLISDLQAKFKAEFAYKDVEGVDGVAEDPYVALPSNMTTSAWGSSTRFYADYS